MKVTAQIDLTSASQAALVDFGAFCERHGLSYSIHDGKQAAPVMPLPTPPKPAAPAARRVRKRSAKPRRDRTIKVTAEETARIVALLRKLDTGEGVATETVYEALGGKTTHWQSVLGTLRKQGDVRDNGKGQRALRVFAPAEKPETVQHGGQTLTKVKPGVVRRRKVVEVPAE